MGEQWTWAEQSRAIAAFLHEVAPDRARCAHIMTPGATTLETCFNHWAASWWLGAGRAGEATWAGPADADVILISPVDAAAQSEGRAALAHDQAITGNRGRRVIIAPHPMDWSDPERADAAYGVYREHHDLTLCVVSQADFERAGEEFPNADIRLVPPLATLAHPLPEILGVEPPRRRCGGVLRVGRPMAGTLAWAADWRDLLAPADRAALAAGLTALMTPLPQAGEAAGWAQRTWFSGVGRALGAAARRMMTFDGVITDDWGAYLLTRAIGIEAWIALYADDQVRRSVSTWRPDHVARPAMTDQATTPAASSPPVDRVAS